jgi:hypothetical protein
MKPINFSMDEKNNIQQKIEELEQIKSEKFYHKIVKLFKLFFKIILEGKNK